ncbi:MAG: hypothetical protein E7295_01755 [Lachnospiraceae bacterium]|jgi:hypothetical protein|nr:hypothetical protein [Lachnospiraceae bacterium]
MAAMEGKKLNMGDFNSVFAACITLASFTGRQQFEEDGKKLAGMMPVLGRDPTRMDGTLRECATKLTGQVKEEIRAAEHTFEETPRVREYRKQILKGFENELQNLSEGYSLKQQGELVGEGAIGFHGLLPNINLECFLPENAQRTERTLRDYPLDRFLRLSNEVQAAHVAYVLGKEERGKERNEAMREEIYKKKRELLSVSRELYDKSQRPTPQILALFGKKEYLTRKEGFIGKTGLTGVIGDLEKELGKAPERGFQRAIGSLRKAIGKRSLGPDRA